MEAVNLDFSAETFARKKPGREKSIGAMIDEILRLDEQAFGSIPLFAPDGTCRMSFEGAHLVKQDRVVALACETLDDMRLGSTFCISCFQVRHSKATLGCTQVIYHSGDVCFTGQAFHSIDDPFRHSILEHYEET